jgi:hypothetical protein
MLFSLMCAFTDSDAFCQIYAVKEKILCLKTRIISGLPLTLLSTVMTAVLGNSTD